MKIAHVLWLCWPRFQMWLVKTIKRSKSRTPHLVLIMPYHDNSMLLAIKIQLDVFRQKMVWLLPLSMWAIHPPASHLLMWGHDVFVYRSSAQGPGCWVSWCLMVAGGHTRCCVHVCPVLPGLSATWVVAEDQDSCDLTSKQITSPCHHRLSHNKQVTNKDPDKLSHPARFFFQLQIQLTWYPDSSDNLL